MNDAWTWLASHDSNLLALDPTGRITAGMIALTVGLILLAMLMMRARRGTKPAQLASEPVPASIQPPPEPPVGSPRQHEDTRSIEQPYLPVQRGTTTNPLREPREWRVITIPHGETRTHASAATFVVTPPPGAVALVDKSPHSAQAAPADGSSATPSASDQTYESLLSRADADINLGLRLLAHADDGRVEALQNALSCFRRALEVYTRESAPNRWAAIYNDIGHVYQELPVGDRAAHLKTAIMYHQTALEIFDPVHHPVHWAWTQSALGACYQSLPTGSPVANARAAIAYFLRALDVFTRETAALAWAWNKNNLAAAYEALRAGPEGERVARLRDAEVSYAEALEVYTSKDYPVQHQVVAQNLARVRAELKTLE